MEIKLTKQSVNKLMNWHAGAGVMYLSTGEGNSFTACDIFFRRVGDKCRLGMGNSKMVELTEEQSRILGTYAKEDKMD